MNSKEKAHINGLLGKLLRLVPKHVGSGSIVRNGQAEQYPIKRLLELLFHHYVADEKNRLAGKETGFGWEDLWANCWPKDYAAHKDDPQFDIANRPKVSVTIGRARDTLIKFYASEGRELPQKATIEKSPYRLVFQTHKPPLFRILAEPPSRANTIGLLFGSSEWFNYELVRGVEFQARFLGYWVVVAFASGSRQIEADLLSSLSANCVGMIVVPALNDFARTETLDLPFRDLHKRGYPFLLVERQVEECPVPFVGTDYWKAGEMAAEYLLRQCNVQELLVIAETDSSGAWQRLEGFLDATKRTRGSAVVPVVNYVESERDEAFCAAQNFFAKRMGKSTIGIFATDDEIALGVRNFVDTQVGSRMRKRISIIGFGGRDNLRPAGSELTPSLKQDHLAMSQTATRKLVELINLKRDKKDNLRGDLNHHSKVSSPTYSLPPINGFYLLDPSKLPIDQKPEESQFDNTSNNRFIGKTLSRGWVPDGFFEKEEME